MSDGILRTICLRIDRDMKDDCSYTKFKETNEFGVYYFATKINGEAFGKISYRTDSIFLAPIIEFSDKVLVSPSGFGINSKSNKEIILCSTRWSPAMTLRSYIESVMLIEDFVDFSMGSLELNPEEDAGFSNISEIFPDFF
jgi:hypothetical protein